MKYKNFLLRAVDLLLILGVLWQYQQVALIRAEAVSQRKQEIAEVEAYNSWPGFPGENRSFCTSVQARCSLWTASHFP